MSNLPKQLLIGLRLTLFTAALALVYTFVITGISQVAFNSQANGSLVTVNGKVVGSTLIGQSCPGETLDKDGSLKITINPKYFQGRLSYTYNASTDALEPCNAANSAGSNLGPSNPLLQENVKNAVAAYEAAGVSAPVPIDLVTSDFTGFDPDISEAAALAQVNMVANARGLDPDQAPQPRGVRGPGPHPLGVRRAGRQRPRSSTSRWTRISRASPADAFCRSHSASIISRMSNAMAAGSVQAPAATVPRGHLRVFLGATPGSGKTFAMLREAHDRRSQGEDVVVGFVETHGRKLTEQAIGSLEVIPRLEVEYRGKVMEEMDLDTVLARHPQVVLVDELAHTNVPGLRHAKRYEDVEEILDAGHRRGHHRQRPAPRIGQGSRRAHHRHPRARDPSRPGS